MKNSKTYLVMALAAGMFAFTSCKKGCTDSEAVNYDESVKEKRDDGSCVYGPTIELNGDATVEVALGGTYNDAGATATNRDGSTVEVTTDLSDVDTGTIGTYTVTYTAENENATVTATRTVEVKFMQSNYLGDWTTTSDCGTTFPVADATINAGATSNAIELDGFFTLVGGTATANIAGSTITVPNQTISITGGDVTFSGTGTMAADGMSFTINYTYDNQVPFIGGQGTCTATYTK